MCYSLLVPGFATVKALSVHSKVKWLFSTVCAKLWVSRLCAGCLKSQFWSCSDSTNNFITFYLCFDFLMSNLSRQHAKKRKSAEECPHPLMTNNIFIVLLNVRCCKFFCNGSGCTVCLRRWLVQQPRVGINIYWRSYLLPHCAVHCHKKVHCTMLIFHSSIFFFFGTP